MHASQGKNKQKAVKMIKLKAFVMYCGDVCSDVLQTH